MPCLQTLVTTTTASQARRLHWGARCARCGMCSRSCRGGHDELAACSGRSTSGDLASAAGTAACASMVPLLGGATSGGIPLPSARPHTARCLRLGWAPAAAAQRLKPLFAASPHAPRHAGWRSRSPPQLLPPLPLPPPPLPPSLPPLPLPFRSKGRLVPRQLAGFSLVPPVGQIGRGKEERAQGPLWCTGAPPHDGCADSSLACGMVGRFVRQTTHATQRFTHAYTQQAQKQHTTYRPFSTNTEHSEQWTRQTATEHTRLPRG